MIRKVLRPLKHAYYFFLGKYYPKKLASMKYRKKFGKALDWNNPRDLNEKINWLKFHSDTTSWTRLADKYAVREYVKECGLEDILVPLYGRWDNANDIDFDSLPDSFVLKTNHGYSTNIIVKDKSKLDISKARKLLNKWAGKRYGLAQSEPHYYGIKPYIIAEKLLVEKNNTFSSTLVDYKIWCFNGKPQSIWVCYSRTEESVYVAEYDTEWHYHPECSVFTKYYRDGGDIVPKPDNLDKLLEVAAKLSAGFPQVRVDFYNIDGHIYFGEMTFTCAAGFMDFYTHKYLLDKGSFTLIPKVIILGLDNSNTLGMLRQLAPYGVNTFVVLWGKKQLLSCVKHSKYCQLYHYEESYEDAINFISNNLRVTGERPIIIPTGDLTAEAVDMLRESTLKDFVVPGTTESGLLAKILDKDYMCRLAEKVGFDVPVSTTIENGIVDFNKVKYPCLVKPVKHGPQKKYFKTKICKNQKELHEFASTLDKAKTYQVQEYVIKESEVLLYGYRTQAGECNTYGVLHRIRGGEDSDTTYGYIDNTIPTCIDTKLINDYLQEIEFNGLFSFEYGLSKNKAYFFEVNLRNDATAYWFSLAGANIPLLWVRKAVGLSTEDVPHNIDKCQYFIDEIDDLLYVRNGAISKKEYRDALSKSILLKYKDKNDPLPYFYKKTNFVLLGLASSVKSVISAFLVPLKRRRGGGNLLPR